MLLNTTSLAKDDDNEEDQTDELTISSPSLKLVSTYRAETKAEESDDDASPERIAILSGRVAKQMQQAVKEVERVNSSIRLLALNAKIEAARLGTAGAAFGVVASEISSLSERTTRSTSNVFSQSAVTLDELQRASNRLTTEVRGIRLSDLALTNIDLIDRNLYERSCDVRWWATDSSAVDALTYPTPEKQKFAGIRFGVILSSYTVYLDLVLCDLSGRVVANGRPGIYHSNGMSVAHTEWFKSALATQSGEEFGFQSVHTSQLVNGSNILAYSCCVREDGNVDGKPLGVLGILFNWDGLGQTIVDNTPLTDAERALTHVCIVDGSGSILSDNRRSKLGTRLPGIGELIDSPNKKHFEMRKQGNQIFCIGHAVAPGFETYTTGWHSFILQEIPEN